MTKEIINYELTVNGEKYAISAKSSATLQEVLRDQLGLTGTKHGCDGGECGACTVLLNGGMIYSCMTLAAEAAGKEVTTIEGLATPGKREMIDYSWPPGQNQVVYEGITGSTLDIIQEKMLEHSAFQCGFCVPGRIIAARSIFNEYGPEAMTEQLVKHELAGHLCRCGYGTSVEAILDAAETLIKEKANEQ